MATTPKVNAVVAHSVLDGEREIEQTLTFNVEMAADIRKAAASDDIGTDA